MGDINSYPALFVLLSGGIAGSILWRTGRRGSAQRALPVTADWIEELSVERYRPMLRLLDADEVAVLKTQPDFAARQEAQFRSQRARVFQGYLRCLSIDFERISMAMRVLMVRSRYDRPDLARVLIQHQILFASGMAVVRTRLFLYRWGLCDVDASGPIRSFEALRRELCSLLPSAAASQA